TLRYLIRLSFPTLFLFNAPTPTEIYTLSLHDALPIWSSRSQRSPSCRCGQRDRPNPTRRRCRSPPRCRRIMWAMRRSLGNYQSRSEEHTSELQSRFDLVCRLLLEKKKKKKNKISHLNT